MSSLCIFKTWELFQEDCACPQPEENNVVVPQLRPTGRSRNQGTITKTVKTQDKKHNQKGYRNAKWAQEIEKADIDYTNVEKAKQEMIRYRDEVEMSCQIFLTEHELNQIINSWEFMINHDFKLIYCPIFKAASSTWIYNFLLMAGANKEEMAKSKKSPVEYARRTHYPRPNVTELQEVLNTDSYSSMLIVREPFQRLLSAYKDKIEKTDSKYYRSLRCKVKKNSNENSSTTPCDPTFSEFVNYLIDEFNNNEPPNEHWAPYHTFCTPCQAKFKYILRFESLAEHEAVLRTLFPDLSTLGESRKIHSSHTDYNVATAEYFSQLTEIQIDKLLQIYIKDFNIFGYDPNIYYNLLNS